jgi:hypothetical protein
MEPDHKPDEGRDAFAAMSPAHSAFVEAGGYDAYQTLHRLAKEQGLPHAIVIEVGTENHAAGFVPSTACIEVQCAAMAAKGDLESLLSGLAAALAVPVGPQGDGDLTEGG